MTLIPYATSYVTKDDKDAVMAVLDRNYFTRGQEMRAFEDELCAVSGKKYAVAMSNATVALWAVANALWPRVHTITPTLTYSAIINAAYLNDYSVEYLDVDQQTLCTSLPPVSGRPSSIFAPMDYAGYPSLEGFGPIGQNVSRSFVLLDAAHSYGATLSSGESNVTNADAAVYSFHPAKVVCGGEGGAVVTDHEYLAIRLRELRNNGFATGTFKRVREGLNLHMDEMSCALALSQSKRIREMLAIRHMIADTYFTHWRGDSRLILPASHRGHSYHLFVIRLADSVKVDIETFRSELAEMGVGTQRHYQPLHQLDNASAESDKDCPVATAAYKRMLSIPMYVGLSPEQQQLVMDSIDTLLDKYDAD